MSQIVQTQINDRNIPPLVSTCCADDQSCVAHLFLKRAGDQPAELAEAVVDSVTAPLFNDLPNHTTCYFNVLYF